MITTGETIVKYKPIDKLRYIRDVLPYIEKENYFLFSAICSMGKALGSEIDDFHLIHETPTSISGGSLYLLLWG